MNILSLVFCLEIFNFNGFKFRLGSSTFLPVPLSTLSLSFELALLVLDLLFEPNNFLYKRSFLFS
jgi:hypothetical protein